MAIFCWMAPRLCPMWIPLQWGRLVANCSWMAQRLCPIRLPLQWGGWGRLVAVAGIYLQRFRCPRPHPVPPLFGCANNPPLPCTLASGVRSISQHWWYGFIGMAGEFQQPSRFPYRVLFFLFHLCILFPGLRSLSRVGSAVRVEVCTSCWPRKVSPRAVASKLLP
jgi:hypothetical protein